MGRFTVISSDAMDMLQLDAGVILTSFNPANPVRPSNDDILAVTSGGINIVCQPTISDFFEDVDNAPANTVEGVRIDRWDCSFGFTNLSFNAKNTKWSLGAADVTEGTGNKKITPRPNVDVSDFKDLWWVGDKANGGAYAIHLMNAISTGGINYQTSKNGKGTNTTTFTGHTTLASNAVPMEFYEIDPDSPVVQKYYVRQILSNVTSSQDDGYIEPNESYLIRLTPATGMVIEDVKVLMGGVDISGFVVTNEVGYSTVNLAYANLSDNITIYASAHMPD